MVKRLSLLALLLASSAALAQDIPNHSIPIGGGPGAVGWKSIGPCALNQTLVWASGVAADPTCGAGGGGGGGTIVVGSSAVLSGVSGNFLYNNAGLLGERTPTQTTATLNVFTSTLKGLAPLSGGGTVNFLRADGTWANPTSGAGGITLNAGAGFGLTTPGAIALGGTGVIGAVTDVLRLAGINVPLIKPNADSTTAVQITNAAGTNQIVRVDTTNNRVGVNKTPGAFDFDVNGPVNVGSTLTFGTLSAASLSTSTTTITGLVANNTPNTVNDYFLYFSAADNSIRKCTIGSCTSAGVSGVSSLNSATGALSVVGGTGLSVATASPNITVALSAARQTLPNIQSFTSGTNLTYTTPANTLWLKIRIVGGGGGGSGAGGGNGSDGTISCVKTSSPACTTPLFSAGPGTGGDTASGDGGNGGTIGGSGTCNITSVAGGAGTPTTPPGSSGVGGGSGGNSFLGGGGNGGFSTANAAAANTGGGGQGGAALTSGHYGGAGGGAGGTCEVIINSPAASYIYTIGVGGGGGTSGGAGFTAGGNGAAGRIVFEAHFGS